jgi:hypothetical protein
MERQYDWRVTNRVTLAAMQTGHDVKGQLDDGVSFFDAFSDRPIQGLDVPQGNQWGAQLTTTFSGSADLKTRGGFGALEGTPGRLEGEATVYIRHDSQSSGSPALNTEGYLPVTSLINPTTVDTGLKDRPVDLYGAWFRWQGFGAEVAGYYHQGKGGWGADTGDIFTFNPQCYDLYSRDIYNGKAPVAVEAKYNFGLKPLYVFDGDWHGMTQGLSVVVGPTIYAGAAPQIAAQWNQHFAVSEAVFSSAAMISQEFLAYNTEREFIYSEYGVKDEAGGKAALWGSWRAPILADRYMFQVEAGAMASNWHKLDQEFRVVDKDEMEFKDTIGIPDILSFKGRLRFRMPYFSIMLEGLYAGLVADTNSDWESVMIGSLLTDVGKGNRIEGKASLVGSVANFGLTLNGLYRTPLVPANGPVFSNYQTNPFSVTSNRETLAFEAVLAFDLEPASWIWEWNAPDTESAKFATTLVGRYTVFEGPSDPDTYLSGSDWTGSVGQNLRAYMENGFPETKGNYSVTWRAFCNPNSDLRIYNSLSFSRGFPNNGLTSTQIAAGRTTIQGWSETLMLRYKRIIFGGSVTQDLWGPGWYMDWNLTFPWRWTVEAAFSFKPKASLMNSNDRVGIRWNGVTRDEWSPNSGLDSKGEPTPLNGKDTHELVLFFDISF